MNHNNASMKEIVMSRLQSAHRKIHRDSGVHICFRHRSYLVANGSFIFTHLLLEQSVILCYWFSQCKHCHACNSSLSDIARVRTRAYVYI